MASGGLSCGRRVRHLAPWLRGALAAALGGAALALLILGLWRTRQAVVLDIDGQTYRLHTQAATVGLALDQVGLELYPEDWLSPPREAPLRPGTVIRLRRARPVTLEADGAIRELRTHAQTAGALLAEAAVVVGPGDEVWLNGKLASLDSVLWPEGTLSTRQASHRGGSRLAPRPPAAAPPVIFLRRATTLSLDDGGQVSVLHTTASTVGQVLAERGVLLYLADKVTPGLEERITPGLMITIRRSVAVQVVADGREIHTRTLAGTVGAVLGQEGIALVGMDVVEPGLLEPIRPGLTIRVTRVREELAVEFEPIPFDTVWMGDPELEIDQTRLAQAGQVGLTKRRYRLVFEDGRQVSRTLEDSWTEQQPVTKSLAYGTKIVVRTLDTPDGPVEYWRKMRVYTTSYTAASSGKPKDHPRYGYTRLGWKLTKGIVAVDPTVIPLKTRLYIPGYGLARAGDTGGGVKGKFVDLGFDRENYESWHWWTDVYLLTPVPPRDQIRWVLPNWPKYPDRRR